MKQRSTTNRPDRSAHAARQPDPFFAAGPGHAAGERGQGSAPPFFQAKLRGQLQMGEPGDRFEREADQVADKIVAQSPTAVAAGEEEKIQRSKAPGTSGAPGARAGRPSAGAVAPALSRSGGGQPLPAPVQGEVDAAFGLDLGAVRVHTDDQAAAMSSEINANAFTHGTDIYFARGQFAPATREGRHLLAHEVTHVVQQSGGGPTGTIQADFAVAPTTPGAAVRVLTAAEIATAITVNSATVNDAAEIELVRDILGIPPKPAVVDDDFIRAVARYQAENGLTQDGQINDATRRLLSNEILAEADFLGFTDLGGLATGVLLRTRLLALIAAKKKSYATYRKRIRAVTALQRDVVLVDQPTLRALRGHLTWNSFARCVELLGRQAPDHATMIANPVVLAELSAAWTASNPTLNPPGGTQHEEGGWVYLDLITGELQTRREAPGAGASINLTNPPILADNVVVSTFHTHPNLGPGWVAGPSPGDTASDAADGVPDIIVGTTGVDPAVFTFFPSGPVRRAHLAGNQGRPGPTGGLAPQARRDGSYDAR